MRIGIVLLGLASVLLIGVPALASEKKVTFGDDVGDPSGGLTIDSGKTLPKDTILAALFRAEHPLRLSGVDIAFWGSPGDVEFHVWRDNGGNQPGAPEGLFTSADGADRIAPRVISAGEKGAFVHVDLSKDDLNINAQENFWVGVKLLSAGANVAVDSSKNTSGSSNGILQTPASDSKCFDGCGIPGNYVIKASGVYVDPLPDARWFADVTTASGIIVGGRMSWGDCDGDGDDDLLIGGNKLFRNDGSGKFVDITQGAGLDGLGGSGGLWGDYDNDGLLDIFVFGGKEHLIRNLGGMKFQEVALGNFIEDPKRDYPTEAAAWVDYDLDGKLDVYTANYEVVPADDPNALGICDWHFLWHNNGDGTFTDVAAKVGMHTTKQCGRSVAPLDWDGDGDGDIYVGNYRLDPNYFWRNEHPESKFTDIAKKNSTIGIGAMKDYGHTIGATWADADNDGDFDLFVANLAHPRFINFSDRSQFYQNLGAEKDWGFQEMRESTGIGYLETHSNPNFADIDNDGDLDVSLTAVYVGRKGQIWRNDGKSATTGWLQFSDVTYPAGWIVDNGWGSAWADFDNDGDVDQAVSNKIFRNDYSDVAHSNGHWIKVSLHGDGKAVNGAAIGAWATVKLANGQVLSRLVSGGSGLACQDSPTMHFGLGTATQIEELTVHWPGAAAEKAGPFAANQTVTWTRGAGAKGNAPGDVAVPVDASNGDAGLAADAVADSGAVAATPPTTSAKSGGCTVSAAKPLSALWLMALAAAVVRRQRRKYR